MSDKLFEVMVVRDVPHNMTMADRERIMTEMLKEYASEIAHAAVLPGEGGGLCQEFRLRFDCYYLP